jgi:hypothetical protein
MTRGWVLFGVLSMSGCASWYLRGAEMADRAPATSIARYTVTSCTNVAGQTVPGPQATYYLSREAEGPVLYEIESNGRGARIINQWSDEAGQHFFVWVGTGPGWHYVFPGDSSQPPTRYAYDAGTYGGEHAGGVTRPAGTPSATCVMQQSP